jgi:hypothetical protein
MNTNQKGNRVMPVGESPHQKKQWKKSHTDLLVFLKEDKQAKTC